MTNEETINRLNNMKEYYNDRTEPYYVGFDYLDNEALDMAIKALKQQSITWIVGKDNCQVAVRNMPIDKMQKICAIIEEEEQQPCEDCISREDAIKQCGFGMTSLLIADCLRKLPPVTPKVEWIPVSERLPEANGRYVVTRGLNACGTLWNRVYIINYSDLMGLKSERIWWSGNVGKSDFEQIDDVIAWMPLPESYKAESEE